MTTISPLIKAGFVVLTIVSGGAFPAAAQADSGSAQGVMVLVVLPNDTNLASPASKKRPITPNHQADTRTSLLEQAGSITYRIWVAI